MCRAQINRWHHITPLIIKITQPQKATKNISNNAQVLKFVMVLKPCLFHLQCVRATY